MHKIYLLDGQLPEDATQKFTQKRSILRNSIILSLGLAISYAIFSQPQNSATNSANGTQSLWLHEPKNIFQWSDAIDSSNLSQIVDILSSPSGDLFGITVNESNYRSVYKFNILDGKWSPFELQQIQIKDIKFDKAGNLYPLDTQGNLYAKSYDYYYVLLKEILDFEFTSQGQIQAISSATKPQDSDSKFYKKLEIGRTNYILYSPQSLSKIAISNDKLIFVDENSTIIGYGNKCIKDLTSGVDGSLWALSCKQNSELTDYQLINWDPISKKWLEINNTFGVKIAAFNEISISILNSLGQIRISTDKNRYNNVEFYENLLRPQLFEDSVILNSTNLGFVQDLVSKKNVFSKLCYRATINGFQAEKFHKGCDYQGASLTILKSSKGRIAGAYTSNSFIQNSYFVKDEKAFIFSSDLQVVIPIKIQNPDNAHLGGTSTGPTFGYGRDLYVCSNSNIVADSYSNLGSTYQLPQGLEQDSIEAKTYLFGEEKFLLSEIEVYILI
ncbi:UNKNOWN [Stylonychia lemnae]|uniref:TLDc domain-containing protein n=1 Tax=Stylonychia lemnae TaxID=5949 RepID=A0A078AT10_STYLE|nr:UNKNOWN [Stylonychia lemnae]|eukprot:CDW85151.1 UNKNOWN [Stylonychia lemnae]